jgi:hypothetical protein
VDPVPDPLPFGTLWLDNKIINLAQGLHVCHVGTAEEYEDEVTSSGMIFISSFTTASRVGHFSVVTEQTPGI